MKVKLIRDKLPAREGALVRPANSIAGKQLALIAKIHEEAAEIAEDATNPEEYADLLTALLELARLNHVSWDSIEMAFQEKLRVKGGFRRGMIMVRDAPILERHQEPVPSRIIGQVQIGDVLRDGAGKIWTVIRVLRGGHESNPHVTLQASDFAVKTIWLNTMKTGKSRWRRVSEGKPWDRLETGP